MIKFIAAITMLIDHAGMFLFPRFQIIRIIGRISMPLFAFSLARGFFYSRKKGTVNKYIRNILVFAIISQIPFIFVYMILKKFTLNIGFTWLFALILLKAISSVKKNLDKNSIISIIIIVAVIISSIFVPVDYGIYGVILPVIFYFFMFKSENPIFCFLGNIFAVFINTVRNSIELKLPILKLFDSSQIFSIFSVFIIMFIKPYENKIRLPKKFFYWFYPIHLGVIILIRYLLVGIYFKTFQF